tara:strand:- start:4030 stop:4350 length:321 start_codon:yes stop_codon:yes gene_type:complete
MWEEKISKGNIHDEMKPWRKHLQTERMDEEGDIKEYDFPEKVGHKGMILNLMTKLGNQGIYTEQKLDKDRFGTDVRDINPRESRHYLSYDEALEGERALLEYDEEQ